MCNRARFHGEPETLFERFSASWGPDIHRPNKDPRELFPDRKAYVVRQASGRRVVDVMNWDVLGGAARYAMTNVRNLGLPQWRKLAAEPENRCLVPLTSFCEWTPTKHDLGDGKKPIQGEMWFDVTDQPVFAVGGFWQSTGKGSSFAMVTCDPNELVAPNPPKGDDHDPGARGSRALADRQLRRRGSVTTALPGRPDDGERAGVSHPLVTDQAGFAPGVPHFANLPFASLHRAAFAGAGVHLMNLPVFGSLHGAANAGALASSEREAAANSRWRMTISSLRVSGREAIRHRATHN